MILRVIMIIIITILAVLVCSSLVPCFTSLSLVIFMFASVSLELKLANQMTCEQAQISDLLTEWLAGWLAD